MWAQLRGSRPQKTNSFPLWDDEDTSAETSDVQHPVSLKASAEFLSVETSASVGRGGDLWESESGDENPAELVQPYATMDNHRALLHIKSVAKANSMQHSDLSMMTHLNGEAVTKDWSSAPPHLPYHTSSTVTRDEKPQLVSSTSSGNPWSFSEAQPKAGYIADLSTPGPLTAVAPRSSSKSAFCGSDIAGMLFEDADDGEERQSDVFFECTSDIGGTDKVQGTFEDSLFLDMVKKKAQENSAKKHHADMSMVTHVNGDCVEEERPEVVESLLKGHARLKEDRSAEVVRNYLAMAGVQSKAAEVRGTFADFSAVEAMKREAQSKARSQRLLKDELSSKAHVGHD